MTQNLLLNEVLRKMSDPATLAALQAATAPLIAGLQQKQAEVKETIKGNQDPLSSLFDLLGGSVKVDIQKAEEEQSQAEIKQDGERIIIELTGNGFMYNMVRIIAGTIVDVGLGKIKPEEIPQIIESKDRTKAGKTLPAEGLYLVEVYY